MWTPGMGELIVILVILLVLFGPGKLPQVGKSLGSAISQFKNSVKEKDDKEDEKTENPGPQA
ncbi:MAG: twin-arginine translocase TatA/TatE family subunit [Rhodospirillales bacterium]|jgi:sec-independent protein translocase protein TatA|nr:twin-arginine translocase TatA/TatE family subunit [Rhodospirillales bacterium]